MRALAARIDEADVRQLAELVARLSPTQQRVVDAVADGFGPAGSTLPAGSAAGGPPT